MKYDKQNRMVLPKQWRHWAMMAGLRLDGYRSNRDSRGGFYLRGKNRNWRVTCHGDFECSCPLPEFDRWANSHGAFAKTFPQNKNEFIATVKQLREETKDVK